MVMKFRKLLVYEDSSDRPYILLNGKWLQKLGFHFHDVVEIKNYNDKIVIKKEKTQIFRRFKSFFIYNLLV